MADDERSFVCAACGKGFTRKSKRVYKYCGKECAELTQRLKLLDYMEERKRNKVKPPRKCDQCGAEFVPYSKRHIHCGKEECKANGLAAGVERQRIRRLNEKRREVVSPTPPTALREEVQTTGVTGTPPEQTSGEILDHPLSRVQETPQ